MSRVFTVEQAADYLQVKPYTLRKWLRRGKIPGCKIGRVYRILEEELEALIKSKNSLESEVNNLPINQKSESDDFVVLNNETFRNEQERRIREWKSLSREERLIRINAAMGKFAHVNFSSDDLIRERREEVEREEQQWKEHFED